MGEFVVNGCSKCAKYYPGQVDQCMTCGGTCGRKVCDKNNFWDCVTTAPFKECHRACMTEDWVQVGPFCQGARGQVSQSRGSKPRREYHGLVPRGERLGGRERQKNKKGPRVWERLCALLSTQQRA